MRLRGLQAELGGNLVLRWQSYLLRPRPRASMGPAALEKFRAYSRSWLRPAAEPESGIFRVWQGDAGPPSHSIPPHLVAKAAARLGPAAFERIHDDLLRAYFGQSRDISDWETLEDLWRKAGLPDDAFALARDPDLHREVLGEYRAAIELGVTGVPTVRMEGGDALITGAHPRDLYARWIERTLRGEAR